MDIRWDARKNEHLKKSRGVSFEELIGAKLVTVLRHASRERQWVMLFEFKGYVWVVPFVKDDKGIFLKTLFPSRKFTKEWKKGGLG